MVVEVRSIWIENILRILSKVSITIFAPTKHFLSYISLLFPKSILHAVITNALIFHN